MQRSPWPPRRPSVSGRRKNGKERIGGRDRPVDQIHRHADRQPVNRVDAVEPGHTDAMGGDTDGDDDRVGGTHGRRCATRRPDPPVWAGSRGTGDQRPVSRVVALGRRYDRVPAINKSAVIDRRSVPLTSARLATRHAGGFSCAPTGRDRAGAA